MQFLTFLSPCLLVANTAAQKNAISPNDPESEVILVTCIIAVITTLLVVLVQKSFNTEKKDRRKFLLDKLMGYSRADIEKALGAPARAISLGEAGEVWVYENYVIRYSGRQIDNLYPYETLDYYIEIMFNKEGYATSWTDQKKQL